MCDGELDELTLRWCCRVIAGRASAQTRPNKFKLIQKNLDGGALAVDDMWGAVHIQVHNLGATAGEWYQ